MLNNDILLIRLHFSVFNHWFQRRLAMLLLFVLCLLPTLTTCLGEYLVGLGMVNFRQLYSFKSIELAFLRHFNVVSQAERISRVP